jgi:hypothetical protein
VSDFSFTTLGLVSLVTLLVGVIGLLLTRLSWRKPPTFEEGFLPISEWRPTGNIDFVTPPAAGEASEQAADAAAPFVLRAEDYRMLESMAVSGARRVEFRWRAATLVEAKRVVSHHNTSLTTISDYLPHTIRSPYIVPGTVAAADKTLELTAPSVSEA